MKFDLTAIAAHVCDSVVFVWDIVDNQVEIVAGTLESFGIGNPPVKYKPSWYFSHIHPDDRLAIEQLVSSVQPGQDKVSCEYRIRRDDGTWTDVMDRAKVIWQHGKVVRFIGVTSDVSVLANTKRDLLEARKTAETASSTKSRFLANMSHEIRTPLNAVSASIDLLCNNTISKPESRKLLRVIQRNARHVLHLVDDILDLAKVEAGMLRIESKNIQLMPFVRELSEVFQIHANAKDLHFTVDATTDVPAAIMTDPSRLRQILNNLVGNAVKFTSRGFVRLNITTHGSNLEFRVTDSGPGIAGTEAQKLFHPFAQLDESLSRRHGGTGLGLNLSKKLAVTLGGDLELESSVPGVGSTFLLRLPCVEGKDENLAPPTPARSQASSTGSLTGRRVLLVDDADDNRMLFQKILELRGASVSVAANGKDCVDLMERWIGDPSAPEVVLMDIEMPVMDGPTALRRLRDKGYQGPIIAVTAHAMNEHRQEYLQLGFDAYISKPVDPGELVRVIRSLDKKASIQAE